jgi:NTE family protein
VATRSLASSSSCNSPRRHAESRTAGTTGTARTDTASGVRIAALAVALALPLAPPLASAQDGGPRIGLALSGGGARGLAHVGVLKVLDELRVPVHCVTGTSMGAIVGATFAAGRKPQEIEQLALAADWDAIFRDQPPRDEIAVRRKIDDYKTLFAPEYGAKDGGLALPKGLIAGVSIESFFRELAAPSFTITNFDRLPIPFRAMATDIETGESVVIRDGNLAQAMRASMSVPGAIAPVEHNGRLLVDGGIANNLPIDEARRLCGDVIIAVNISTPPLKRQDLTSALSVASQLINFLGKQTVDSQLERLGEKDVLIAPELGDISSASFKRAADAVRIGEQATRALADQLGRYSLTPERYAALRDRQVAQSKDLGTVDEIRVEGLQRTNPVVVQQLLDSKPGEPLTEAKVGADLRRVYGTRDYESITYRVVGGETGPRAMVIEPREKDWGPDYLRFGLALATDFDGENQFNVMVQYRRTWLNRYGAEWLTEAQIGQNSRLFIEFYQPLSETRTWFVAPGGLLSRQTRGLFIDGNKVAEYRADVAQVGIDLGAELRRWGQLRVGPVWSRVDSEVAVGSPLLPAAREVTAGLRAALFVDQTDHAYFPNNGYGLVGSAYAALPSMGSDREYQRLEGGFRGATSVGPHIFSASASGGTALGSELPSSDAFTLGGPLRLSAYRINEFTGREYAYGRLMYYRRAVRLPDILGAGVYVGGAAEVGRITDRFVGQPSQGTLWSASAFVGADTALGPLYFGAGAGPDNRWSLFLLLGVP